MRIKNNPGHLRTNEIVLFPFDDFSIPLQNGVRLRLIPYKTPVDRTRIVVAPGPEGAPDSRNVLLISSICKVADELFLWYHGQADSEQISVCFAKSSDGYVWEKPNLGLVEYAGSRDNNVVAMPGGPQKNVISGVVFYDEKDSDTGRRFKSVIVSDKKLETAFSEDGLSWRKGELTSALPFCEISGGMRFNDCYYVSSHGGSHFGAARQLVMFMSYDFERWTEATCLGFQREQIPPRPMVYEMNQGEQIHGGAALWNRGNVIVGLYGQWHGPDNNDRRHVDMDLGLVISNDGLHYKEPIPDFRIVEAAEDGFEHLPASFMFKHSGLMQGQGFENLGDETLTWYTPWPEQLSDGVRVASWVRDRLGYFEANIEAPFLQSTQSCHVISAPIELETSGQVLLNIDGLSEHSHVTVELLDEYFKPVTGYSSDSCLPIAAGLRSPVAWKEHTLLDAAGGAFRIRLNFGGVRPEDAKLYAIYVTEE